MTHKLSIIIPCYNCEKTLREAFLSVVEQNLEIPYEIVMVDDCSTDKTRLVIEELAKKYQMFCKCVFHQVNKGGGATRNTAVQNSTGAVIFCLDSDDILPSGTLTRMYKFLNEKQVDAVGLNRSIKFVNNNIKDVSHINTFGYVGENISINSLIEKKDGPYCPLYSVFMFSKRAWEISGGYPENHGFDTQGFAWNFLANGLVATTCPEAEYFHRINDSKSYYIREYESGKTNYNWFKIYEKFFYLFNENTKKEILTFNFNHAEKNICDTIKEIPQPFRSNIKDYIVHKTRENAKKSLEQNKDMLIKAKSLDIYWLATVYSEELRFSEALYLFRIIKDWGLNTPMVLERIEICQKCLDGQKIELAIKEVESKRSYIKFGSQATIHSRLIRKIKRLVKSNNFLFKIALGLVSLRGSLKDLLKFSLRKEYYSKIKEIIKSKEIVLDIQFGGLGDWMVMTSLPRLLKEQYNVDFYLSQKSIDGLRNKDVFKLCFENNPYFKGTKNTRDVFSYRTFSIEKRIQTFLFDINVRDIVQDIEKQFKIKGNGLPELFYDFKNLPEYNNVILVDDNYISGKKMGWLYNESSFEREAKKHSGTGAVIEKVDTTKQDLFKYANMIYSCKHFITVLSGGAALATTIKKPFTVILPSNIYGGSADQFVIRNSKGYYTK